MTPTELMMAEYSKVILVENENEYRDSMNNDEINLESDNEITETVENEVHDIISKVAESIDGDGIETLIGDYSRLKINDSLDISIEENKIEDSYTDLLCTYNNLFNSHRTLENELNQKDKKFHEFQQSMLKEKEENNSMNSLMKTIIAQLRKQINGLNEEISYLRNESLLKSNQISSLIDIMKNKNASKNTQAPTDNVVEIINVPKVNEEKSPSKSSDSIKSSSNAEDIENVRERIEKQLSLVREKCHSNFINSKINNSYNDTPKEQKNHQVSEFSPQSITPESSSQLKTWPENTVLFIGDSMLAGIDEKRLSRKFNTKVRSHPGANIDDMLDHIKPYLRKKPKNIVLHVSTNDASNHHVTSEDIFKKLIELKSYINKVDADCKVTFSCPLIRNDNSLANLKIIHLRNKLKTSKENIITNENIDYTYLGRKGLHLTPKGDTRLAMNFIDFLKHL